MKHYKIVRHYQNRGRVDVPGLGWLTLKQAQAYCHDPETSSRTCSAAIAEENPGQWFDGWTETDEKPPLTLVVAP